MSASSKFLPGLLLGLAAGGLCGGIGGYIAHDLIEKPNPETMQQIEQAEQTQQNLDDFLNSLAAPAPAAPSGAVSPAAQTPVAPTPPVVVPAEGSAVR